MKQPQSIQINIPNPCSQNWEEMTPSGNGRHCAHCSTTVIDFTTWSDAELYKFFTTNTGHICGHYLASQVGRPIHILPQPHSRLYRMVVAMGLTLMAIQTPVAHAQVKTHAITQTEPERKDSGKATGEIIGIVTDMRREPLVNANVIVKQGGILKDSTVTDFDGKYAVKSLAPGYYDLFVTYPGYRAVQIEQIVVSEDKTGVNVRMETGDSLSIAYRRYSKPMVLGTTIVPNPLRLMTKETPVHQEANLVPVNDLVKLSGSSVNATPPLLSSPQLPDLTGSKKHWKFRFLRKHK